MSIKFSKMKQFFFLFLAVVMIVTLLAMNAYAANANQITSTSGGIDNLTTPGSKLCLLNRKDHIAYIAGRTNTQAAPDADITRAEVAAILYRLLTSEAKSAYPGPFRLCRHGSKGLQDLLRCTHRRVVLFGILLRRPMVTVSA